MNFSNDDTIAAVATPAGAGGVGIVRVSGPEAFAVLERIFVPAGKSGRPDHARLLPGWVCDPEDGTRLDFVLAVRFEAPRSFTGEDVSEIQAHGGRLNLEGILHAVFRAGARPAEPGEFTLRAFLNGRMDLSRAEAVREVIESQTGAALAASRRHLQGDVYRLSEDARADLRNVAAHLEALLDFPDEDLPDGDLRTYLERLDGLEKRLGRAADSYARGRLLHQGLEVMIVGLPNVGKSSLLNRLARSRRAIVTDRPGTTRDFVEALVDLGGLPVRFVDTAGFTDTADGAEAIGVEWARERLERTDFVLLVLDRSERLRPDERHLVESLCGRNGLLVWNKSDRPAWAGDDGREELLPAWPRVSLSALTGEGLSDLETRLVAAVSEPPAEGDALILTSERHARAFEEARGAIRRAAKVLRERGGQWELSALELRGAMDALGEVIGLTTPDDILEEIFSRFCIGK